jgi:serine/threonine protein phosphatase PrpC
MPLSIYGETNVGRVRTNNEDCFTAQPIWQGRYYLAVVIDGVGGYEGGEVAAQIANEKINGYLVAVQNGEPATLLKEAVIHANEAIYNERQKSTKLSQMSCVLTACIIDLAKKQGYMAHVGDTRLYVYSEAGGLKKISHDHSIVG